MLPPMNCLMEKRRERLHLLECNLTQVEKPKLRARQLSVNLWREA